MCNIHKFYNTYKTIYYVCNAIIIIIYIYITSIFVVKSLYLLYLWRLFSYYVIFKSPIIVYKYNNKLTLLFDKLTEYSVVRNEGINLLFSKK